MKKEKQKSFCITAIILIIFLCLTVADSLRPPRAFAEKGRKGHWQSEENLLDEAADSLVRLEKAIRKDGFSSAMTALNIWRSAARDAGAFDPVKYNDFKKRIYQRFIEQVLKWFDTCVDEGWLGEAKFWAGAYHVRSSEIGTFDAGRYEDMQSRIQKRMKQIQRKKAEKNAGNK